MPKISQQRLDDSLDVSGAFDNCFFHAYAAHLLANELPFPEDLFTFASILGDRSAAAQLQARFPNAAALSLFADFYQFDKPDSVPLSPSFIVEKTLILGFLLREWFATKMAESPETGAVMEQEVLNSFEGYKEGRTSAGLRKEELLSGAEGVLYLGNQAFLEYFAARPNNGHVERNLTEQEQKFENYFTGKDVNTALSEYWWAEGYLNYCQQCATPGTKLAENDVIPAIRLLEQPLDLYYKGEERFTEISGKQSIQKMEVYLNVITGHYQLLKTDETKVLFDEYEASFEQYKADRKEILATVGDKLAVANSKPSLLVGSICPSGHLAKAPFTLLLEKIDIMQDAVRTCEPPQELHNDAEAQRHHQQESAEQIHQQELADKQAQDGANKVPEPLKLRIDMIFMNVDAALNDLAKRISREEQHPSHKARVEAEKLLFDLHVVRDQYHNALHQPGVEITSINNASQKFKQDCRARITTAKKILANDLGWGDYLKDLLNALMNAVIWVFSMGTSDAFFKRITPASVTAVDAAQIALDSDPDPDTVPDKDLNPGL